MSSSSSAGFDGVYVAAFESRMAGPMADLIARQGGVPIVAPALREVALDDQHDALAFADRLIAGEFDVAIFLTGVGTRYLAQAIETRYPREQWVEALGRIRVVARGPKPVAALRELKARVDVQVPEPNTWHEVLAALDSLSPPPGQRVAVQEYGKPSTELIEGLRQRGATVTPVPVYRWMLPEDIRPLKQALAELARGGVAVALFTSAQQVEHLLEVADREGRGPDVRRALESQVVVGSIGPTTTEALRGHGLRADIEPEHPKMGHLVSAAAAGWRSVRKPAGGRAFITAVESEAAGTESRDPGRESRFLRACRREPTDVTPIWLMRQAGRYMSEYRELRSKVSFLELCKSPDLATEVTVTAAERLGVDAAILFADILLVLEPLGFALEFTKGEGPCIRNPIRAPGDVDRVRPLADLSALGFVFQSVRQVRSALGGRIPLIGFAGAPFTLACYAIEGGASRHYDLAKAFMYRDSGAWSAFMEKLADATAAYLNAQIEAGAQAVQIFDSWVGTLGPADYRAFVLPAMQRLFRQIRTGVPVIHFGTGTGALLELQREAGGDVIGLDWRVSLAEAWSRLGPQVAVQGNLDPAVLLAPVPVIRAHAQRILGEAAGRPGHIFNLGHGILPTTPVAHVTALVEAVHGQ